MWRIKGEVLTIDGVFLSSYAAAAQERTRFTKLYENRIGGPSIPDGPSLYALIPSPAPADARESSARFPGRWAGNNAFP